MMLNLYVQQHQWIVATLLVGVALMLLFWLTYAALWLPREEDDTRERTEVKGGASLMKSLLSVVPLVLILLAVASASFTIVTLVARSCKPPNW